MKMLFGCKEKDGLHLRSVTALKQTPKNVGLLLAAIERVPNFTRGVVPAVAMETLMDKATLIWQVDDVGVFILVEVVEGERAHAHMTFWDGRLRGREGMCRKLIQFSCKELSLHHLYTVIPLASRVVRAFAKRVGFVEVEIANDRVLMELDVRSFTVKQLTGAK